MKKILELNDSDVGEELKSNVEYSPRTAARAILFKEKKIAILHVSKHNYHKLPGGGVEEGESIQEALRREVLEETGCTVQIEEEVGETIEHKSHDQEVQTSHCFFAKVQEVSEPMFTEKEKSQGFQLIWITIDEAIKLLQTDTPLTYVGKFIIKRDLAFIQEAKKYSA